MSRVRVTTAQTSWHLRCTSDVASGEESYSLGPLGTLVLMQWKYHEWWCGWNYTATLPTNAAVPPIWKKIIQLVCLPVYLFVSQHGLPAPTCNFVCNPLTTCCQLLWWGCVRMFVCVCVLVFTMPTFVRLLLLHTTSSANSCSEPTTWFEFVLETIQHLG